MALGRSSAPITSVSMTHTAGAHSIATVRLRVEAAFVCQTGGLLFRKCVLDSGAPLCVVPYDVHQQHGLAWQPVPGPWPPGFTTWLGVPCTIGHVEVWMPIREAPFLYGPLPLIAKFAQATPATVPGPLPVLLGLNFLVQQMAEVAFQCHTVPYDGAILLPLSLRRG